MKLKYIFRLNLYMNISELLKLGQYLIVFLKLIHISLHMHILMGLKLGDMHTYSLVEYL